MVEPLDSPAYERLDLYHNSDVSRAWTWEQNGTPVALDGFAAQAQIRRWAGGDLILDLVPYLTVDAAADAIKLVIPGEDIAELDIGRGYWDLFLVSATQQFMFMWGHVSINPAVTVVT